MKKCLLGKKEQERKKEDEEHINKLFYMIT